MFKASHLSFRYDATDRWIFRDLSLEIAEGSFTVLLGHNGCGKSTLARLFGAFLYPSEGEVTVGGLLTTDESAVTQKEIRSLCGMVFQNPDNQIVASVVEDDVAFGPENRGIPTAEMRTIVDDALKAVGMYSMRSHAPNLLSGGQKQRVAIAGILALSPRAIILDEPTAMLDPAGRREVLATLHRLHKEQGITILLITHHMDEALEADRVIVLEEGKIYLDGAPRDVFTHVEELRSVGLEVPTTAALLHELNKAGFSLDSHCIGRKELAEAILEALHV